MKINLKYLILTLFIIIVSGCNNFKRFEQKKYFCKPNELNIDLIDVLETSSIKKAYITMNAKEFKLEIISLTDEEINLQFNKINIIINKINNNISAFVENKVFFLNCEESNFNI